jgi:hypothetical protein
MLMRMLVMVLLLQVAAMQEALDAWLNKTKSSYRSVIFVLLTLTGNWHFVLHIKHSCAWMQPRACQVHCLHLLRAVCVPDLCF